jgi:ubiquinone/menaquinone biosynthesis C-methylase UbiE
MAAKGQDHRTSALSKNLDFTGERFTPECIREIRYEHFHRYAVALGWVHGLKVLDAACGEGYGAQLLSARACEVTGIDISGEAVAHAKARYVRENLQFLQADCCSTPFDDGSFDCVVSFETLEHLHNQEALLAEFRRVLKPGGFLVISTPDKAVYSDKLGNKNEFHVKELYRHEFESLLGQYFPVVQLLGQKLGFHSMIWPLQEPSSQRYQLQQESGDAIHTRENPSAEPVYLLAVCAATQAAVPKAILAPDQGLFLFDDESESVYQHYYHEIRRNLETGAILQDLEAQVAQLQAQLSAAAEQAGNPEPKPEKGDNWLTRWLRRLKV